MSVVESRGVDQHNTDTMVLDNIWGGTLRVGLEVTR